MGPLPNFAHSMEPHLRKLGMPTRLNKGVIELDRNYVVCREGVVLTPEQAKILVPAPSPLQSLHRSNLSSSCASPYSLPSRQKLLEIKMSQFSMALLCVWRKTGEDEGTFEVLAQSTSAGHDDGSDLDEDESEEDHDDDDEDPDD